MFKIEVSNVAVSYIFKKSIVDVLHGSSQVIKGHIISLPGIK